MLDTVELFLKKYDLTKENIIVAFSGGYDSMCLLDILKKLSLKHGFNLTAIHLNHNWRGRESDKDEQICKEFCYGINFYSEKLSAEIPHTETAARNARYEFFEKCAKKFNSKAVLTAHNANDNAETVFYRMIKGTGLTGLEGISEHRGIYYRPLLKIYRKDIEKYCAENNLKPNIDSSNFDTKYVRNKIRLEIFPVLKSISPDFEEKLNELSISAKAANKLIDKKIKNLVKYAPDDFLKLDEFLQNSVIHKFFRENDLEYDRKKIDEIKEFIKKSSKEKSGKTISLTNNLWLFANDKKIKLTDCKKEFIPETVIKKEGEYKISDFIFEIKKCDNAPEIFPKDNEFKAYASFNSVDFVLRSRKDGDIIKPLGLSGTQKLKKYLNEKKIPKHEKDNLLFLCENNEVLWAPGLGISEKIKVKTKPTHVLSLRRAK